MGSSAVLRRWISSSGISRSRSISYFSNSAANRMMSTAATSGGVSSPPAPWLMLPPAVDESGDLAYRFQSLATKEELIHKNKISSDELQLDELQLPAEIDLIKDVDFVGSSHGWLALYNRRSTDLFLSNPIADRHVKLPPLPGADRVILSASDAPLAFATFGSRRELAFCRPHRRGGEWTHFGGDYTYDNLVYSTKHKRLFCVCHEQEYYGINIILEGWDVDRIEERPPKLDWVIQGNDELNLADYRRDWPGRSEFKKECLQVFYMVCDEHSGDVFLVVRHVNPRVGPFGALVDKIVLSHYRGCHFMKIPYKTFDFDVYRIDFERGEVINMVGSLGGLAIFLGINEPFTIPAIAGVVKADCIYFTDENVLVGPTKLEKTSYGGHDNGVFDYEKKDFYPCCDLYPIEYEKIRKILPLPLWFTPAAAALFDSK
ncbi:uncharacterized protein LOC131006072 [Salvia miltiorrhiza]|uniref:uncharacterized protein LOC131006072 n=1 Tax=Salvia miltiorrhiza TaxID=226208 RepID=UPI0025ABCC34|nr:uncharacterized protein LOC131006072 [Salvia miltiorrhiza]